MSSSSRCRAAIVPHKSIWQAFSSMLPPDADYARAVSLYEKAWRDGVPIAAFELGQLYERGFRAAAETAPVARQPDLSKAWSWYRKGADIGEPNALARFGERDETSAVTESSPQKRDALLLKAFASYAAAADRAQAEGWPDDTWRHWRYRRATLARLLAREGMMPEVADAYMAVREQGLRGPRHGWKNQAIPTDGSLSKERPLDARSARQKLQRQRDVVASTQHVELRRVRVRIGPHRNQRRGLVREVLDTSPDRNAVEPASIEAVAGVDVEVVAVRHRDVGRLCPNREVSTVESTYCQVSPTSRSRHV